MIPLRFARQAKLVEVGEAGHGRIAASHPRITDGGFAGVVAARYLAGAGVARLTVASEAQREAALEVSASVEVSIAEAGEPIGGYDDLTPAARDVARGAAFALEQLRACVHEVP